MEIICRIIYIIIGCIILLFFGKNKNNSSMKGGSDQDDNFTNDDYKDGEKYIEEGPFVKTDEQEHLSRDYRNIIFTRYPSINVQNIPNKWKNRNWNNLKEEIRNGENKLWTNQLLSYMRNRKSFHLMLDIIKKNNVDMTNIVDATANIGGDAIGFAMEPEVKYVKAYEIKHTVYDMLVKNIELYGLSDKIETICGPFDYDVPIGSLVIIDPPFERANSAKLHYNLSIDMMPIYVVVQRILEKAGAVITTMPRDYKYNKKYADENNQQVDVYETSKNVKVFLIRKSFYSKEI